tara:strand:- start:1626 stop:2492 length:867 start_codon:yes stop_codon:yes gene_type:complete
MAKKLTKTDHKYIRENYLKRTDGEIADVLGCTVRTIERSRKKMGLMKRGVKENEDVNLDEVNPSNTSDDDLGRYYKSSLISSVRGKRLRRELGNEDWETLVYEWVAYHMQLDDLTHTEENTIEHIIVLKLRMDKNQKDYLSSVLMRDSLMEETGIRDLKDLDLQNPEESDVYEKVYSASVRMTDLNKEYKELLDKITKMSESLNVTRRQREEKGRVGAETFFMLCKEFESRAVRQKEGRKAGLLRLAAENNERKMRESVQYMDGEIAPQLLDSETIELMEKQKGKNDE